MHMISSGKTTLSLRLGSTFLHMLDNPTMVRVFFLVIGVAAKRFQRDRERERDAQHVFCHHCSMHCLCLSASKSIPGPIIKYAQTVPQETNTTCFQGVDIQSSTYYQYGSVENLHIFFQRYTGVPIVKLKQKECLPRWNEP